MRGVAALLVVIMHLLRVVAAFYEQNGSYAGWIAVIAPHTLPLGLIGVDLFFVISGFVLFLSARRSAERGDTGRFALNRFLRIYPLYWIVFLFSVFSTSFVDPTYPMKAMANWPEWFLIDVTNRYDVIAAAWTLMYEVYFYAGIVAILLVAPVHLEKALVGWVVVHLILITLARVGWIGSLNPVTDAILMDFAAGMLIAHFASKGRLPYRRVALLLCVPMLALGLVFLSTQDQTVQVDRVWRLLTFGVVSVALIYVAVSREQDGRRMMPSLRWLGDASYSLYIWHLPVFWTLNWTGSRLGIYSFERPYLTALVWGAITLATSILSYRWIERPILHWMKKPRTSGAVAPTASL
ncbi:peptidoglycan/LPS O-acetylase OafA/YrhL [Aureimonas pseudogalii]|uniref:Peptidoglycan/LPS O-acetylase OafA/YrhL n=2 Tax=Aureimonas pseudogalii TaxID=1744844 RepID=A0A7W6E9M9_9HYPH|nr:peptidoglycan/LPS O-acetylase OafA/YrhL [Aureimonas pseudogalii]